MEAIEQIVSLPSYFCGYFERRRFSNDKKRRHDIF